MTSDKMTIVNGSVPPQIWNHTAVRLDHFIIVTGGQMHKILWNGVNTSGSQDLHI